MHWKLYIDSPQQRAFDFCYGSLTEGDGEGDGLYCGYNMLLDGDGGNDNDGYCDCWGEGDGWGDGYGYGYGDGRGDGDSLSSHVDWQ